MLEFCLPSTLEQKSHHVKQVYMELEDLIAKKKDLDLNDLNLGRVNFKKYY